MRATDRQAAAIWAVVLAGWVLAAAGPAAAQLAAARARTAAGGGAADSKGAPAGLHIPQGRQIAFEYTMTDGAGFVWNIQPYGAVGSGTNNAYSGGMYLHINGNNPSTSNRGWVNEAGDEIETGPQSPRNLGAGSGLQVYRRVKVYKDAGLARWLDIFQNNGGQAVTLNARLYTNFNWTIGRVVTSSGAAAFGEKDWAFATETTAGMGNSIPSTMHVLGDKRSKLRPQVIQQGSTLYYDYTLTVPAGGTVILCHFEAQNTDFDKLVKDMQNLKPAKLLKDLPSRARALVANFGTLGGTLGDVELERSEAADTILLADEDPLYGSIQNESYAVQTLLGALTLPADKVIGMAVAPGEEDQVRFVLSDGQVVSGRSPGTKLTLNLPTGGRLEVPLTKVKSWSYRISKAHPEEPKLEGPLVVLRTADQLAFDPAATPLTLRTRYGPVEIKPEHLLELTLDNASNGVHRAVFLNGTRLAGLVEPDKIALSLKLGQRIEVSRDLISRIRFASEDKPDDNLCQALLSNEDELWGNLADSNLTLATAFGTVDIRPASVKSFTFTPAQPGRVALLLWDGTVLRGQLRQEELTFQIAPGPALKVPVAQIASIARTRLQVSDEDRRKVERLVGLLGAESFKDRQTATEDLIKLGPGIVPLLQKYLTDSDPEVRQRLGEVLEKLTGAGRTAPPRPNFPGEGMWIGG